jgi:hypothetical protein
MMTAAERQQPSDVIREMNPGGVESYHSKRSMELLKEKKAPSPSDPNETHEERLARLEADAGKPYWRR